MGYAREDALVRDLRRGVVPDIPGCGHGSPAEALGGATAAAFPSQDGIYPIIFSIFVQAQAGLDWGDDACASSRARGCKPLAPRAGISHTRLTDFRNRLSDRIAKVENRTGISVQNLLA